MSGRDCERVQRWVDAAPSPSHCAPLSPSSEEEVEVMESPPLLPHQLEAKLLACPICHKERRSDPQEILDCISSHNAYLCLFCLTLLRFKPSIRKRDGVGGEGLFSTVLRHNRLSGHFSNPHKYYVKCPLSFCPDSECWDQEFYFLGQFRNHIYQEHLPTLHLTTIRLDEFGGKVEAEEVASLFGPEQSHHSSSGYHSQPSPSHLPYNAQTKGHTHTWTQKERGGEVETQKEEEERGRRGVFCPMCGNEFKLRAELNRHQQSRVCPGLEDKWCRYCECSFEGFTIMASVLHLLDCQTAEGEGRIAGP